MNAAARLLNQGALSRGWVISLFLTRFPFSISLLFLAILSSALSLVYITNHVRTLHGNLQQASIERDRLQLQWGQLMLEKSTLLAEHKVQDIAKDQLDMLFPEGKSLIVIENE